jgi:sugar phosphate isomerase/epimerase
MWAQGRFQNFGDFVAAVLRLGFSGIEINYTVEPQGLEELLANSDGVYPSFHSPVPRVKASDGADRSADTRPRWSEDLNLASPDEEERRRAVAVAATTLDWAAKVGAGRVVVHLGGVGNQMLPAEKQLRQLFDLGQINTYGGELLRADCRRQRAEAAPAHLAAAKASLRELADQAARLGIAVGLENRYHYHEIPHPDEAKELLADYPPNVVGYWHDMGHAEVLDRLQLVDKHRWLEGLSDRFLGVHLHDVVGLKDHQAPGQGDADWKYVARYLPPAALRVCEINQHTPEEQVAAAIPYLREQGIL